MCPGIGQDFLEREPGPRGLLGDLGRAGLKPDGSLWGTERPVPPPGGMRAGRGEVGQPQSRNAGALSASAKT